MTTHKKSPVEAATSTGQSKHLPSNSDFQSTANSTLGTKTPRPKLFHAEVHKDDPQTCHTLCGLSWPRQRTLRPAHTHESVPMKFCPACANLQGLQSDLDATMKRAEEIHQAMLTLARYLKEVD